MAQNVNAAVAVYFDLLQRKIPSFCPHLSALIDPGEQWISYDDWLQYDFRIIDRCTHILMLDRWETSVGAKQEHEYAHNRNILAAYPTDRIRIHYAVGSLLDEIEAPVGGHKRGCLWVDTSTADQRKGYYECVDGCEIKRLNDLAV